MKKLILIPLLLLTFWAHGQVWTDDGSYVYPSNITRQVGIGTQAPAAMLHIQGSSDNQLLVENSLTTGGNASIKIIGKRNDCNTCQTAFIDLANYDHDVATTYNMARIGAGTNGGDLEHGYMRFSTGFNGVLSERMRITSDGKVGIGQSNPLATLHVNGEIRGNQSGGALRIQSSSGYVDVGPKNTSFMHFYTDRAKYYFDKPLVVDNGIYGAHTSDNLNLQTDNTNRLTILSGSGNVGIGQVNPLATLHVNGEIRGNQSGGALRIQSSHGYIDVGPRNSSWAHINTDMEKFYLNKPIYAGTGHFSAYSTTNLQLQTDGTTRATILNATGFMGIGDDAPDARLHVATAEATTAIFENSSTSAGDASIKILGKRNECLTCDVARIDLANDDFDEPGTTEFVMARISGGMHSTTGRKGNLKFYTSNAGVLNEQMRINNRGEVFIGTENAEIRDFRLYVEDGILTEKIVVAIESESVWPDYVFAPEYNLRPLTEVATFVEANSHLPEVPSAKQVAEEGVNLAEMNATLLQKVEELTLYLIDQNEQLQTQNTQLQAQQKEIDALKQQLKAIQK